MPGRCVTEGLLRCAVPDGCTTAAPVETSAAADNKNRRLNAPGGVVKVAVAMMMILAGGIVVRPGRGVPRLFDPAASRGEAGASLRGLLRDVKLLPKIWIDICRRALPERRLGRAML